MAAVTAFVSVSVTVLAEASTATLVTTFEEPSAVTANAPISGVLVPSSRLMSLKLMTRVYVSTVALTGIGGVTSTL